MSHSYARSILGRIFTRMAAVALIVTSAQCATQQVLHNFDALPHGASPQATLIADTAGNLYGTAYYGDGLGVVFELSPNSDGKWTENVLYNFTGDTMDNADGAAGGAYPQGSLAFDAAGNLYGTTSAGGRYGVGTVFELSPSSNGWQETVLWSFAGYPDGAAPSGGVIFDQAGNLYGTTENGGDNYCYCGTVFELSPALNGTWAETTIDTFVGFTKDGSDGARPRGSLVFDQKGNLFGTTENGGYSAGLCRGNGSNGYGWGCGTVFELSPDGQGGWSESVLYAFDGESDGANPIGSLVFDQAGNLYGTTYGYLVGKGSVFRLARRSWTEKTIFTFSKYERGRHPWSGLVFDAAGNLFGTTEYGGDRRCSAGCGTIYELSSPDGVHWAERVVHAFEGSKDGGHPLAGLLLDSSGGLYAAASSGRGVCKPNCGAVIKLTQGSRGYWSHSTVYDFPVQKDGAMSYSNLIADGSGNLYGTTEYGGDTACNYPLGCGTAFKLTQRRDGSWKKQVLHNFNCDNGDGGFPVAGLIFDSAGILYGTTQTGGANGCRLTSNPMGGTVFALSLLPGGAWRETILFAFTEQSQGDGPTGGVIFGKDGKLYGTTVEGGGVDAGTVFQLSPVRRGPWKETVLYNFTNFQGGDGASPQAALIFDSHGDLYGTTTGGGRVYIYAGTIFKLMHPRGHDGTWTERVLYTFLDGEDGGFPRSALIADAAGNLYGTATQGGAYNAGVVFELSRGSGREWTESTLHSFVAVNGDGAFPNGSLVFDGAGNLYGTTSIGGTNGGGCGYGDGCGTVFELTPSSGEWTETILERFTGGNDGGEPFAGLLFDQAGNLYGTTLFGGETDQGVLFELKP